MKIQKMAIPSVTPQIIDAVEAGINYDIINTRDCYMKQSPNDAIGMKGDRSRVRTGKLRQKRSDTLVTTLQKKYNEFYMVGVAATLGAVRSITGLVSLNAIRRHIRRKGNL